MNIDKSYFKGMPSRQYTAIKEIYTKIKDKTIDELREFRNNLPLAEKFNLQFIKYYLNIGNVQTQYNVSNNLITRKTLGKE